MSNYIWIVSLGGIFSFIASMGIGANDVANSFATSVGSKTLTMKQAVILACIFETLGAVLMGSHVSETIRKGIANYECFQDDPYSLMYGCMWVCFSVATWLFTASYLEMPVSTTHSCIGGMIGMTIAIKGSNCVIWYEQKDNFPYIGGVIGMIISWFVSPVLSGCISSSLYYIIRQCILRKNYESKYIYFAFPLLVGITITLNTFFIIYKGAKGLGLHKTPLDIVLGVSFGLGLFSGLITIPILPKIYKYINNKYENKNDLELNSNNSENKLISITHNYNNTHTIVYSNNKSIVLNKLPDDISDIKIIDDKVNNDSIINIDINKFSEIEESEKSIVEIIHNNAEKFDERTEIFFKYLQVFSASCAAFSHGANDVANAIGPFAAILTIYWDGDVRKNSVMDNNAYWILSIGGIGISIGLLLYGYKIIRVIGIKLCKITPARGTIIELSAALVTIFGSRLKIPLSTTHCQIGATCGVGLLESSWNNNISGINNKILFKTIFGWVITCVFVGLITGLLTAQGIYAPSLNN
jgi:solute carrier family 20 (sodium-dependent phosphate transporter)